MMSATIKYLFPRLPGLVAKDRYQELAEVSPAELREHASTVHRSAEFAPTGGQRVSKELLSEIRNQVLEIANDNGFPEARTREQAARFDAECAELLHKQLPIITAEAARNEVWSFLALVLMPDIARWRYPNAGERRFLGGVRNTFQRLWWRGKAFLNEKDENPYSLLHRLDEDVMVGIMERPGISSNDRLALALGIAAADMADHVDRQRLEDARRDALKRVRQRVPVVCLEALADDDLNDQVDEFFSAAITQFNQ